jgi:hypothetical protein
MDLEVQQRKFREELRVLNYYSTESLLKKLQKRPPTMLYNFKIPVDVCLLEGQHFIIGNQQLRRFTFCLDFSC